METRLDTNVFPLGLRMTIFQIASRRSRRVDRCAACSARDHPWLSRRAGPGYLWCKGFAKSVVLACPYDETYCGRRNGRKVLQWRQEQCSSALTICRRRHESTFPDFVVAAPILSPPSPAQGLPPGSPPNATTAERPRSLTSLRNTSASWRTVCSSISEPGSGIPAVSTPLGGQHALESQRQRKH